MVKMTHLNLKLLRTVIAIARETLDRLIQLLGSFAQVEKNNATIHKGVEQVFGRRLRLIIDGKFAATPGR